MRNQILEKYAKLLVNYSLKLKPNDKLLICSTYLSEALVNEVYKQALINGANVEFKISLNNEKVFYDFASETQLNYVPLLYNYAVESFDAILTINAPFNLKETQNVNPEKKQIFSKANSILRQKIMQRSFEQTLRWSYCEYPTNACAQEANMSLSEYEDFVFNACFLYEDDPIQKWLNLKASQQKLVDFLNNKKTIRFVNNDTDITFSVDKRIWINSCGDANMPSGEVFTAPIENSGNGIIRFSYPGIYMGYEIEDITLEVKNGEVVKAHAKKGNEVLQKILELPNARYFGEIAIGTNYNIKKFIKNMLFDEKIGGTIHLALGSAYPHTGGKNESVIHWDLLADMMQNGEIYADNELIYKNGYFII